LEPSGKELEMKRSRYTDEQIAFALKQAETGTPVAEVIRRIGISEQTFYRWKKVYGGLGVGELRRRTPAPSPGDYEAGRLCLMVRHVTKEHGSLGSP
jgi:transposase-like protein